MKRMVWIAALAAAVLLTPFHSRDAAKLKPVKVLCLDAREGRCVLETDNGLFGLGPDPAQAVADLERTAPGIAVLSTARHLVATDAAAGYLRPLLELEILHPGTALYGQKNAFRPLKIAVDEAGGMYVISKGNTNGIAQFSADGAFLGYFGANSTEISLEEKIKRLT